MNFAIFGLTVSSSWGNGHATLWRGLIRALATMGHQVTFFERDVPYYAETRDLTDLPGDSRLVLYSDWQNIYEQARAELRTAEIAMVTSYCPDGVAASNLVLEHSRGLKLFYDLDTPVTLATLKAGTWPAYLPPRGLDGFDLVLSYTGGEALQRLQVDLGARRVAPLYGHVDPELHRPVDPHETFAADLSYLGTYAADRQAALETLFIEPARQQATRRFVLGGSGYPQSFPWTPNIFFVQHLPPSDHPAFFSSARMSLNVTRADMAAMGYCPSGRLFEAAACGSALISDGWVGLDMFFEPGREITIVRSTQDVLTALARPDEDITAMAEAARRRVLGQHRSIDRARELLSLLEGL